MSDFEFQRFITIGQYLPTGSVIHRLDPRARLVAAALLIGAVTATSHFSGLGLVFAVIMLALAVARIPLSYALKGLLPPLPFIVILALLQILFGPQEDDALVLAWNAVRISWADLHMGLMLVGRFAALILTLSLFSFCVSTRELVTGLEALLRPLTALGVPTHDVVLMVQVTLRFLPLLAREAERIAKSQASRGAEWGTGRGGWLKRTRQALPLLVPLFLSGLRRAENLALAMEARCYTGGRGRTSMVVLRFRAVDGLAILLAAGVALAGLVL
ncbi:MAG: energy-coupling factor transporter transmembrane component T family protein [Anaerolineae bacterium]